MTGTALWRCLTGSTLAPSPHSANRTGRADLSGSAAIAGFCPHRTRRAALPQRALQGGPEAARWPPRSHAGGSAARVASAVSGPSPAPAPLAAIPAHPPYIAAAVIGGPILNSVAAKQTLDACV